MSCPGLHCPGCSGPQTAGIGAAVVIGLVVLDRTVQAVAENIIPIVLVTVTCFVLSVAASMWLEGRTRRREVAWGHQRGIYSRADYIAPPPVRAAALPAQPQTVIQGGNHYHLTGAEAVEALARISRGELPAATDDRL